jgi:hypothetical protein
MSEIERPAVFADVETPCSFLSRSLSLPRPFGASKRSDTRYSVLMAIAPNQSRPSIAQDGVNPTTASMPRPTARGFAPAPAPQGASPQALDAAVAMRTLALASRALVEAAGQIAAACDELAAAIEALENTEVEG